MKSGYLHISEFVKTGRNVLEAMKSLPKLHPFDTLNNSAVIDCVTNLFTEANGRRICNYLTEKAKVSMLPQEEVVIDTAYRKAKEIDKEASNNLNEFILIYLLHSGISVRLIYC